MIYAYLEIIRLIGGITVLSMTVYNKKYCHVDIFWMRVISSVLMMMGSVNDLTHIDTIHYKSLMNLQVSSTDKLLKSAHRHSPKRGGAAMGK